MDWPSRQQCHQHRSKTAKQSCSGALASSCGVTRIGTQRRESMATRTTTLMLAMLLTVILEHSSAAQQPKKPLTNDKVIEMVQQKLPESVIVSAIKAGRSKFNTSTNELIRLNAAGVTKKELNAMRAASGGSAPAAVSSPTPAG